MATKRSAPDEPQQRQPWKRQRPNTVDRPNHGKKSFKKAHPVNELKSTIRSIRRLLSRNDDLPATVRVEKERELQTAERDLEAQQKAKKRSEIIGKWHKVRFFDRQKAERRLKKARRALREAEAEESVGDVEEAMKRVEESEVEVNYALYYPLEKDYVRLFQTAKKKDDEDAEEQSPEAEGKLLPRLGDPEMWEIVKRCTKEGTLKDLREGRLLAGETDGQQESTSASEGGKKQSKKRAKQQDARGKTLAMPKGKPNRNDEDGSDEDGGGFFE